MDLGRPVRADARGWRAADAILAARHRAVIVARSKRPERVSAVRRPIVQWVLAPVLQFVIVLTTVPA